MINYGILSFYIIYIHKDGHTSNCMLCCTKSPWFIYELIKKFSLTYSFYLFIFIVFYLILFYSPLFICLFVFPFHLSGTHALTCSHALRQTHLPLITDHNLNWLYGKIFVCFELFFFLIIRVVLCAVFCLFVCLLTLCVLVCVVWLACLFSSLLGYV